MTEPSDTGDDVSNDASARDDNDDNSFDASSNEDPEEAAADDSHLRVKRTGRLGPENKRHLRDATIYRKSLFITNPINPADRALKPEQLIMKGMNLNRWEQVKKDLAILGGRRRSAPPSLVPELVQDLVAGKRLREVHGKVYAQKEMWDLRFAKGKVTSSIYEYQWTVLKTEYDKNVAQAVLNQMIRILQVFPAPPSQIPKVNMRWLLDVGKTLAIQASPQIRPRIEQPYHIPENTRTSGKVDRARYRFTIRGFDPNETEDSRAWKFTVTITIGTVSAKTSLPEVPNGDRIDWMAPGAPGGGGGGSPATEHPSDPEYRLAQLTAARYTGSMGDIDTVRYKCKLFISLYTSHRGAGHQGFGIYRGRSIWDAPRPYLELRSVLAPSKAVVEDLTVPLPPLHVLSLNKERWHPALEAMLNDFVDDVMETWHLGGAVADITNDEIALMLPPQLPSICNSTDESDRQKHYHVCVVCCRTWFCFVFEFTHLSDQYKLCRACRTHLSETTQISFELVAGRSITVFDQLLVHLRKENKMSKRDLSDEAVKTLRDESFEDLKADYEEEPGVWHDYVVKQVLREDAERYLTWNGRIQNALQPSIEATNPAPINPETGKTGYHIRGNLGIMSWSMNLVLRHHPKVLVKSLYLLRNANTRRQFEIAKILVLNLLINATESNTTHIQQRRRIGNAPPENMQEVEACWKSGERFSQPTVPKGQILRYCNPSNFVPDIGPSHEPKNWKWLMKQLRLAARQEGLGSVDERYWLKDDVPYFFDPLGPSPNRWRPWDVINFFSLKLRTLRNFCDRLYSKEEDRPKFEVSDLIIVIAHLYMRMLKDARGTGESWPQQSMVAVDEARLPIWCVVGTVLTSSIGHRKHGYEMRSGITYEANGDHVFKFEDCNLAWQAQATNMGMLSFNEIQYARIFAQFDNPRLDVEDFLAEPPYEPGFPTFAETWVEAQDWEVYARPDYVAGQDDEDDVLDAFDITFRVEGSGDNDEDADASEGSTSEEGAGEVAKSALRKKSTRKPSKGVTTASSKKTAAVEKSPSKKNAKKAADGKVATTSAAKSATNKPAAKTRTTKSAAAKLEIVTPRSRKPPTSEESAFTKPVSTKSVPGKAPDVSAPQDRARALYLQPRNLQSRRRPEPGPHCNMTNTTNTCYVSSTLQHFSKVSQLRNIFQGPSGFRANTGRPDTVLAKQYGDPLGSKLVHVYDTAQQVFQGLEQRVVQLPGEFTNLFFNALSNLSRLWRTGVFEDARDFFDYFADAMICVTDRSERLNLGMRIENEEVVHDKTPEARVLSRHREDVVSAEDLPSVSEFATKTWQAHRRCGHESPLFDLLAIQTVDELTCDSPYCGAKAWEPEYGVMLRLNIPQGAKSSDTFSPAQLDGFPKPLTLTTLDTPRTCWRCSNESNVTVTDGKFTTIHTKIVRVPPLLAVHIGRTRLFSKEAPAPEGADLAGEAKVAVFRAEVAEMLGEAAATSFENKMINMELLSLSDLNVQPEDLVQDLNSNPSLLYDLIGLWLHSKTKQHWLACIREGTTNNGRFVRYDDKQKLTEYINLSEVQHGDWTVAMLLYKQRKEGDLPPAPGDVPVPTQKEVAQAIEIVLSSDNAVLVDDEPPTAASEEFADSLKQVSAEHHEPTDEPTEGLIEDADWEILPDGTRRHLPTLQIVVDEYKVLLAKKNMQLDQEYAEQLAEAKKQLDEEAKKQLDETKKQLRDNFASKVETAVRAKAAALESARKELEEDRRQLEAERQRLTEAQPPSQRQQEQPLMLPLEQVAAALDRVPFGSIYELNVLVNNTLVRHLQDQLVTSQRTALMPGGPPPPMTAYITDDNLEVKVTGKDSRPVPTPTEADTMLRPHPMKRPRWDEASAQKLFAEAEVPPPVPEKDQRPLEGPERSYDQQGKDSQRTPRPWRSTPVSQRRPEPRRTDYKSPMHSEEASRKIYDTADPFASPSPTKAGVEWLRPPRSSQHPTSSLSPEFSDLSVQSESERKRTRSPGLLGDSREHRSRRPRPESPEKSPSKSKISSLLNKPTKVAGELLQQFKDPTKSVSRSIGSQLSSSKTGLNLRTIGDRSRLPIKARASSGQGASSPFPTAKALLLPPTTQAPVPPVASTAMDDPRQGSPSPSGRDSPSMRGVPTTEKGSQSEKESLSGRESTSMRGASPVGRSSLRLPRSRRAPSPTPSMRIRAPYPQPLSISGHRGARGEYEYRVNYHGSTSWVPEHRLRKEGADIMLGQYKTGAGLYEDAAGPMEEDIE